MENKKNKPFYSTEELASALHINRHKLGLYRKYGLLKAVKCGRGYSYFVEDIKKFVEKYNGCSLRNETEIILAARRIGRTTKRTIGKARDTK